MSNNNLLYDMIINDTICSLRNSPNDWCLENGVIKHNVTGRRIYDIMSPADITINESGIFIGGPTGYGSTRRLFRSYKYNQWRTDLMDAIVVFAKAGGIPSATITNKEK
jgi:hypothetical protein